jgi:hypothetical protein
MSLSDSLSDFRDVMLDRLDAEQTVKWLKCDARWYEDAPEIYPYGD